MRDHIVVDTDEHGETHEYHTDWRCGELLPFRWTWPVQWQREAQERIPEEERGRDKPLPRDVWYTEAFDGYGRAHTILIDGAIRRRSHD